MAVDAREIARILGGEKTLHTQVRSLADLERVVADGLPVSALNEATMYVGGSRQRAGLLRERIVPRATLSRRQRLKPAESERLERLARVMALAEHVWENREDAQEFLESAHPMLGGRAPLQVAETELGARRVEDLLMKLEYSLPV
jgi:putative toxin-antitoxin system antitoxin component (TIGR02293 family)